MVMKHLKYQGNNIIRINTDGTNQKFPADGKNFVETMASLADRGISPTVIDDAHGRLTFTQDLAEGILHLLTRRARGTYHLSNTGPVTSWHDVARRVFELRGRDPDDVTPVTTAQYTDGKSGIAPRPARSVFTLDKLLATGFTPAPADDRLREYLARLA